MIPRILTTTAAALALTASGALGAETWATAETDLNLRAGPGPNYKILGKIDAETNADFHGCLPDAPWCKVTYEGQEGWAHANYLLITYQGDPIPLSEIEDPDAVTAVSFDADAAAAATIGTIGAIAGSLIGGPVAIAAGAVIGGAVGADAAPDEQVITYIADNPLDPVFLQGEVVVGARVPQEVVLYEVPESEYRYVNVNGQYVLVEPEQRAIVYIHRG